MSTDKPSPSRRLPRFARVVRARPKLFLSVLLGLIVMAALPTEWRLATRMLVGWDVGIGLYLIIVYSTMMHSEISHIRLRAAIEDEGKIAILVLTVAAAAASIAAILVELGSQAGATREPLQLALATATIALSWAFIHTIFALHYAYEFYAEDSDARCLIFPGEEKPNYWDFVYFSFVIGMTSQVSDVGVANRGVRRTVTAHGIVSFFFNVALLALTVNIAASAI